MRQNSPLKEHIHYFYAFYCNLFLSVIFLSVNVAGLEKRGGVILCWNSASISNCEGGAGYEAMTPDLMAVTESTETHGHLWKVRLVRQASAPVCGLLAKPYTPIVTQLQKSLLL